MDGYVVNNHGNRVRPLRIFSCGTPSPLTIPGMILQVQCDSSDILEVFGGEGLTRVSCCKMGFSWDHWKPDMILAGWQPEIPRKNTSSVQVGQFFFPQLFCTKVFYLDVSKNNGTPKSSILIRFSIINHPFWGTPIFGNTLPYTPSQGGWTWGIFGPINSSRLKRWCRK